MPQPVSAHTSRHGVTRRPRRTSLPTSLTLALVAALGATLVSCASAAPAPTPPSHQAPPPVFATEDEALKAAEAAIVAYLDAESIVAAASGDGIERLRTLGTATQFDEAVEAFIEFQTTGKRRVGQASLQSITLQQRYEGAQLATVITYLCVDYSNTRLLDADGNDITPEHFASPARYTAELRSSVNAPTQLLLHSSRLEGTDPTCAT